jgi:hypothetical protein
MNDFTRVGYGNRKDEIFVQPGFAYKIQVCRQDGTYLSEYRAPIEQGVEGGYFAQFRGQYVEVIPVYGDNDFQVTVRNRR